MTVDAIGKPKSSMDSKVGICDSVDGDNRTSVANRVSAFRGTGTTNPGGSAQSQAEEGSVEAALETRRAIMNESRRMMRWTNCSALLMRNRSLFI